jgi:pilus assembly protein Flp/PilA
MKWLRALLGDTKGATAVEYALLAALVSMAAIAAIGRLGNALSATFVAVATDMSNSSDGSI